MNGYDPYIDAMKKFNSSNQEDRSVNELIGIARGITSDGTVNKIEAEYIVKWLDNHSSMVDKYPFNILFRRISDMLSDGVIDDEERGELFEMLTAMTGGIPIIDAIESMSTTLPLDHPMPTPITIKGNTFCLTGQFAAGTRAKLHNVIKDIGGHIDNNVTKKTDFLVIGYIGNENWAFSSHGRKIEKAVEYRDIKGTGLSIVSEDHWIGFLVNSYGG